MEKSIFQVNLTGILKILSDSLYSSKDVFIRELIQNAVDAIKFRTLQENFEPSIGVVFYDDFKSKGLIFSDNGIGLTFDEVNEFLSKIGSSSKANLLDNRNDFIGQFGIGLLSCFMVSNEIVVLTKSIKSNETVKWTGYIDGTYKTEIVENQSEIGTKVILKINENVDFDFEKLSELIATYGAYVGYPIEVDYNGKIQKPITKTFPWIANNHDSILYAGQEFFGEVFTNYFLIETPDTKNKGIAYIIPHALHHGTTQNNRVYIKNMFITDKANDLLPEWAFFVRVVLNSESLAPTASREEIYDNKELQNVKDALGKAIKNYLISLSHTNPSALQTIIRHHNVALKSLCLTDKSFLKFIFKWFVFETNFGDLSLDEIRKQSQEILYISSIDGFRQLLPIATSSNILLVNSGYIYDVEVLDAIAKFDKENRYHEITVEYFGNILKDLELNEHQQFEDKIDALQFLLKDYKCLVDVKRFQPNTIPALFYMDKDQVSGKDIENIKEESDDFWASLSESVFETQEFESKLYLNIENQVVQKLLAGVEASSEKIILEMLYVNSLMMGHYPVSNKELQMMNQNIINIINKI